MLANQYIYYTLLNMSSLYQKYRPKQVKDVLRQNVIIKTLTNSILQNKIGLAYIFAGPKGIGKTTIAKIFSKAINCADFNGDVCNKCESCKSINDNNTTDILELDAASNNGVNDIRNILESVKYLPLEHKYKVYIIDEAHMLTNQAWNALLKTLEEPPQYVVFVFATTEMQKIPTTILSRCQCFDFHRLTDAELLAHLLDICKRENIKISKEAANILVTLADGSARDVLSSLEQAALYTNNDINVESVNELFGLVNNETKIKLINYIFEQDIAKAISQLDEFEQKGVNFGQLTIDLGNIFLDKLLYEKTKNINLMKTLTVNQINSFYFDEAKGIALINECQKSYNRIKTAEDPRFNFEILVFSLMDIASGAKQTVAPVTTPAPIRMAPLKVENKKPEVQKIEPKKPSFEEAVSFKQIFVKKPEPKQNLVKEIKKEMKEEEINIDVLLLQIASNISKDAIKQAKDLLVKIKEREEEPAFKNLTNAEVGIASQNGIIFKFDDILDAEILNSNVLNGETQARLIRISRQPYYLLGLDEDGFKKLAKDLKAVGSKYKGQEPELAPLRKSLSKDDPFGQSAFELFGDIDKK